MLKITLKNYKQELQDGEFYAVDYLSHKGFDKDFFDFEFSMKELSKEFLKKPKYRNVSSSATTSRHERIDDYDDDLHESFYAGDEYYIHNTKKYHYIIHYYAKFDTVSVKCRPIKGVSLIWTPSSSAT